MKSGKARVTESLTVKHETIPDFTDTIKIEDAKWDHLPSECDIVDIPIKQEETNLEVKHYGAILNQSDARPHNTTEPGLTSLNEPLAGKNEMKELLLQFDCQHCNLTFKYESLYNNHVNEMHKLKSNNQQFHLRRRRPKPTHSIESDPADPNFYCKFCATKYATKQCFRAHIRRVHKTVDLPPKKAKPNHNIEPDPADPNFYCKSCNTKYPTSVKFRNHIRKVHKTVDLPLQRTKPNHSIKPDPDDPNFYCKSCGTKYTTKKYFRAHIRVVHKIILEPLILRGPRLKPNLNIKPDPEDSNFYCKSCNVKYQSIYIFRRHIRNIHKMVLVPLIKRRRVDTQP